MASSIISDHQQVSLSGWALQLFNLTRSACLRPFSENISEEIAHLKFQNNEKRHISVNCTLPEKLTTDKRQCK